ncbi:hypothetical protein AgCh_033642 [Apium graveolens]
MEERKWENLNYDCLVNVLKRVDLETKLFDVPLVCKHWYYTLLNLLCWQKLVFPFNYEESRLTTALEDEKNVARLMKFVVNRSLGRATTFLAPIFATIEDVICPGLKYLAVHRYTLDGDEEDMIGAAFADAIAEKLATIKCLVLDKAIIDEADLETILLGCKELEVLYVRHCVGFDEDSEDIRNLASRIKDFRCEGSRPDNRCYVEESKYYIDYEEKEFPPFPDCILYGDY